MNWRTTKLTDLLEYILDEDLEGQKLTRANWIKNKLSSKWKGLPNFAPDEFDKFLEKLAEIDPSPNGIYMPWIAKMAITKPHENRTEDLDRLGTDLANFEKYKQNIERKDINQYKSFQDVYTAIEPFLATSNKQSTDKTELEKVKKDIITIYSGPQGWIRIPTTQASAMFLGQNTRWCTAAKKNNRFEEYNKDDYLFVIYDKTLKHRFQLHIESNQFKNEPDFEQGIDNVPEWARKPIVNYYKKHNSELTRKQAITLSAFDETIAAGTKYEDLINLMKEYGIMK